MGGKMGWVNFSAISILVVDLAKSELKERISRIAYNFQIDPWARFFSGDLGYRFAPS
jgi:hypothetical protein